MSTLLSDWEDDENRGLAQKPHLVIVGGGWGVRTSSYRSVLPANLTLARQAVGVLDKLNPGDYHVTIVSPETYTTFTPLLPCTSILFLPSFDRAQSRLPDGSLWKCLDEGVQATDVYLPASGIPAAWDHACLWIHYMVGKTGSLVSQRKVAAPIASTMQGSESDGPNRSTV